jgi:hypothetical protein
MVRKLPEIPEGKHIFSIAYPVSPSEGSQFFVPFLTLLPAEMLCPRLFHLKKLQHQSRAETYQGQLGGVPEKRSRRWNRELHAHATTATMQLVLAEGAVNSGDTAFVIICTALVLMMALPGLMLWQGALSSLARVRHRAPGWSRGVRAAGLRVSARCACARPADGRGGRWARRADGLGGAHDGRGARARRALLCFIEH